MHRDLNIMTLNQRRDYHFSLECYKQVTNANSSLHHYFVPQISRRTRAGESKVMVPDIRSTTGRKCFSYKGPVHWNQMSEDLKNSESVNAYKSKYLKKVLRDVNHPE